MNAVVKLNAVSAQEIEPLPQSTRLVDEVALEMERAQLSQVEVAKRVGLSSTVISQWLQGKYNGSSEAVEKKIRNWLNAHIDHASTKAEIPPAPSFLETPTSRRILNALRYAQVAKDIAVIYGAAGVGKTKTLANYLETNPNVWLAPMSTDCSGVVPVLEEVALAIGLRELPNGGSRIRRAIINRITGTEGLLVIDEAQHLSVNSLEALRFIYDHSDVGLALVGNELVYGRLTGGKRAEHFAQLFSRVGKRLRLGTPTQKDASVIIDHYNVRDRDARESLLRIAEMPGGLRGLVKTLRMAILIAQSQTVLREHVQQAWSDGTGGADAV